jgi:hypothetical protein
MLQDLEITMNDKVYSPKEFPDFLKELKDLLNKYSYTLEPFEVRLFKDSGVTLAGFSKMEDGKIAPVYFVPSKLVDEVLGEA